VGSTLSGRERRVIGDCGWDDVCAVGDADKLWRAMMEQACRFRRRHVAASSQKASGESGIRRVVVRTRQPDGRRGLNAPRHKQCHGALNSQYGK